MSSRVWVGALVVVFASLVRLPHYDISWFGNDQINFVAEGRRVLSGDWTIVGPLASGFNVIGPFYSYFLAVLLWIGKDAGFVAFVHAMFEVAGAWLTYDTARRLSGQAAGLTAGVVYASAPMLVISDRLIWNPSLLPAAVAFGCWAVVRYSERPSTATLLTAALACGLALTSHATAIFPVAAWVLIVLLRKRPSLAQMAAGAIVGLLPLAPVVFRSLTGTPHGQALTLPFAANDVMETLTGIGTMVLRFPMGAYRELWSATGSAIVLHIDACLAAAGLAVGVVRRDVYRHVWFGLALALCAHLVGAIVYSGFLAWYYFAGVVPIACLCIGHAVGSWRPAPVAAASLVISLAAFHLVFVVQFDRHAIEMGFIRFPPDGGLTLRSAPGGATHGITLREVRNVGSALRETFADGVTAMRASHGARAELWRESGAEFLSRTAAPGDDWASEFVLMGADATVLQSGARLIGNRVCLFERPHARWRVRPDNAPSGWELPTFADDRWYDVAIPRRMMGSPSFGPALPGLWRTPRQFLRGTVEIGDPNRQHLYVVSLHSHGSSAHWVVRFVANGIDIPEVKHRLVHSSVFRNEERLFDLTSRLRAGTNSIALALDGQTPAFDVDVFDLPCLDREWYNLDR